MKNKKFWLLIKAILLLLLVASIIASPSRNMQQLMWRTFILAFLGITFFFDLYNYRKQK